MDCTPLGRFGAAQRAPEQQELAGAHLADPARQQPRGSAVGGEAPLAERFPEPGVVGGEGEVGRERDLEPDAGRPAPNFAHHRDLHADEQRHQPVRLYRQAALDAPGAGFAIGRCVPGDDVGAAAEVLARAFDHDDAQGVVGRGILERGDETEHGFLVDRVAPVGPIETQGEDAAIVARDFEAHGRVNSSEIAVSADCRSRAAPGGSGNRTGPWTRLGRSMVA